MREKIVVETKKDKKGKYNIENFKFFHVKELDNNYSNFLENSLGGFASHSEVYDVAVLFDKEKGLLLCLAKSLGYNYSDICEMVENAKDYKKE